MPISIIKYEGGVKRGYIPEHWRPWWSRMSPLFTPPSYLIVPIGIPIIIIKYEGGVKGGHIPEHWRPWWSRISPLFTPPSYLIMPIGIHVYFMPTPES